MAKSEGEAIEIVAVVSREAYGVRGACSRFRTVPHTRQREQAPRTPYASRRPEPVKALMLRLWPDLSHTLVPPVSLLVETSGVAERLHIVTVLLLVLFVIIFFEPGKILRFP